MPIKVEDAKKYEGYEEDEVKIARFLNEHEKNAYTQDEIMIGIGMASTVYTKDKKFTDCPLCKKPSLWEWGGANARVWFRCPNCMGIISVSSWIVRGWQSPLPYAMSNKVAKIESVGNNSELQNLVGQEYPIEDMQGWASKTNGKQSD